jgi:hypothetical protein
MITEKCHLLNFLRFQQSFAGDANLLRTNCSGYVQKWRCKGPKGQKDNRLNSSVTPLFRSFRVLCCGDKKLAKSIPGIAKRTRELDTNQQQTPNPYIPAYCASLLEQCCSKEGRSIS